MQPVVSRLAVTGLSRVHRYPAPRPRNEPHSTHKLNSQLHTNHIIIIIRIHINFNININPLLTFQPSTLATGLPIDPSIP
jgi:hypothetical protein